MQTEAYESQLVKNGKDSKEPFLAGLAQKLQKMMILESIYKVLLEGHSYPAAWQLSLPNGDFSLAC
jgi:hypothetical protein